MTITFGKKTLFSLLLGGYLLTNIVEITHTNILGISTLLSFCTCILLPGFLISLILRIRKISFWENLLLILGLSLAFLELGGLLINILFPLFGINNPLAFQNLVIGFDVYGLLLFIFAWIRTKQIVVRLQFPTRSASENVLYALPVFFPILAALGAIVLNNGGSNILAMILLGAIACYTLVLILLRNKITVNLYPYAIFFIGLACLFITSLRSWYISGHDIEREFYIFQVTNMHHLWNMAFYQDPYNACLSITILPTILTNLLSLQDIYIYKVVYQILFATTPVLMYFLTRKYTTSILAFLAAFFFVSFPPFFNDMPMLNRQEIGFIFFGVALYVMFGSIESQQSQQSYTTLETLPLAAVSSNIATLETLPLAAVSSNIATLETLPLAAVSSNIATLETLPFWTRNILFVIFGLGVIVSHYSTNFVLIGLTTFIYILYLLTRMISLPSIKKPFTALLSKFHISLKNISTGKVFLSLPLILILFGTTYFWNTLYTRSSDHTGSVMLEIVNSIFVKSNNDTRSSDLSYSIFFASKIDPQKQLQEYIQKIAQASKPTNSGNGDQFYSKSIVNKYPIYAVPQQELAPTVLGNWLSSLSIPVFNIQSVLRSLSAYSIQFFVFIGLLSIFFSKKKKTIDLQYLLSCFSGILLLFLIIVLPTLSVDYGVLRMFQQLLFVLSLPIVLGLDSLPFFIKGQKRIIFTGIIAVILFLNLTGFVSHLTGEYYGEMYLDNAGLYYDSYYIHKADAVSIVWLSKNNVDRSIVESDKSNINILLDYGHITASNEILPPVIRKDAYVFLPISSNRVIIGQGVLMFSSPETFLNDNKNLVYSNGKDNIYK